MTFDLQNSLDDLATAEYADAPVSTVDIGKARADGRRRVLTARLAPIGGGVAVVAACALVVNGLGGTSPTKPAGGLNAASGHQFTGTDPLTAVGRFTWLPAGFQTASYLTGPDYGNSVTARTAQSASSPSGPVTPPTLALTSSPTEPQLPSYYTKTEVTVPGSPKAYLVSNPGDAPSIPADLSLMWQTASGSWYGLGGDYQIHGAELQSLLIKVAGQVAAEGSAVALPIHVEGMPKDAVLGEASLDDPAVVGQGGFRVGLSYTAAGGNFDISAVPTGWQDPRTQQHPVDPKVSALIGKGSPGSAPTGEPVCKDSGGLHICVGDVPGKNGQDPLASVGGAQGLLDRITSLGTDPANWTTHVVN
ncbi:hypothetical protein KGQ20_16945 [Catenulispora sp. NF23]|uniref:hypothetical protein n=1 Tax=Catenulispora pinistramenti TaxID=2705254 RepID=UPI001BABEC9E|nr:hypothetical protein [Catenulispora pinistramenti]MBS2534461.1 hypothetical protein [Catenulispora pinistramenti]